MPDVFKKQTTAWRLDGKKVKPGTPRAIKEAAESRKWYGTIAGNAAPLSADKTVARRMLNKLLADADLDRAGMDDPFAEHRRKPLVEHLANFRTKLEGKGGSRQHVELTMARLRAVLDGIGSVWLADLDAVRAADFLTTRREDGEAVEVPSGQEWFRAADAAELLRMKPSAITKAIQRNGLTARGAGKSAAIRVPRCKPADVADALRSYLAGKSAKQLIWPGSWNVDAAEMLRFDLEAAGIPYAVEGPDGPLYADFHALRHSYLTLGGRAGINLRTLQELAGHSTPTLTARYSHRRLPDLAEAIEKMPRLLLKNDEKDETIEVTSEKVCLGFAWTAALSGH